jgi:hypothetical protein
LQGRAGGWRSGQRASARRGALRAAARGSRCGHRQYVQRDGRGRPGSPCLHPPGAPAESGGKNRGDRLLRAARAGGAGGVDWRGRCGGQQPQGPCAGDCLGAVGARGATRKQRTDTSPSGNKPRSSDKRAVGPTAGGAGGLGGRPVCPLLYRSRAGRARRADPAQPQNPGGLRESLHILRNSPNQRLIEKSARRSGSTAGGGVCGSRGQRTGAFGDQFGALGAGFF